MDHILLSVLNWIHWYFISFFEWNKSYLLTWQFWWNSLHLLTKLFVYLLFIYNKRISVSNHFIHFWLLIYMIQIKNISYIIPGLWIYSIRYSCLWRTSRCYTFVTWQRMQHRYHTCMLYHILIIQHKFMLLIKQV